MAQQQNNSSNLHILLRILHGFVSSFPFNCSIFFFLISPMQSWIFIFGVIQYLIWLLELFQVWPLQLLSFGFPAHLPNTPWHQNKLQARLINFLPWSQSQPFLQEGQPGSFSWRRVLETKIWVLGVLIAVGVSFAPRCPLHTDICVCVLTCVHKCVHKYFYM